MPNLYIIAGCNGAGKTTASFTVLPEMLDCDEFINADEIARGISPLNPEKASIEAGRFMLTKSYTKTVQKAKERGYQITLLYFWLASVELAIERVHTRVIEGGHNIPEPVIIRRYYSGLINLFNLYLPICDYWMIFDNSISPSELIAEGYPEGDIEIINSSKFETLKSQKYDKER